MPIKAIIFDMDGVLIDAKEWHYQALNHALERFGYVITREEHLSEYDGLPTKKKLELLSERKGFSRSLHQTVNELKQHFTMELAEIGCHPRLQHVRTLSQLKNDGYILGLASNSIRRTVHRLMELSSLTPYLNFMLSNEDVSKPKPDPEIYRKAAQLADVSPNECVVLEDNHHGIEAATKAGAHVLPVTSVDDVSYERISDFVAALDGKGEVITPPPIRRAI